MASENVNVNIALDDLLAAMDDVDDGDGFTNDKNGSPVNESLYESAMADQTWLPNLDSPNSVFENYEKLVAADFFNEFDDDDTPTATPNSSVLRVKSNLGASSEASTITRLETLQSELSESEPRSSAKSFRRVAAYSGEASSTKTRLETLQSVLSESEPSCSAESLRRIAAVRIMLRDSPIDFVQPTVSRLSGPSEIHKDSESSLDGEEFSSEVPSYESSKRIASQPVDVQKSVTDLREKAKVVSEKIRRSFSAETLHRRPLNGFRPSANFSYDSFFKICVNNPKVSPVNFQMYAGEREKVRLSQLTPEKQINWNDWITMGVLVNKSFRRKSAKGSDFLIWKICDLLDCHKLVRLFLFGDDCVDKLNNLQCGTVLALINASKMPKQDGANKDDLFSLKIDNYQKVLEIGSSPDYGYCKGVKKTDGVKCTNLINKSFSEYCDFHLMSASKKFSAKRGEFQLNSNVPPKFYDKSLSGLITAKIKPFSSLSTITAGKPRTLDLLKQLSEPSTNSRSTSVAPKDKASGDNSSNVAENSNFVDMLRRPSVGTMNVLKQISHPNLASASSVAKSQRASPRQFLAAYKKAPVLDVKAKAVAIIKAKVDFSANKLGPNKAVCKRIPINQAPKACVNEKIDEKSPLKKRQRLGDLDVNKEKLALLLAKKSTHEELVEQDDQEQYFKLMEAKEKVEERATKVMELKSCKVVTCKTCDYTWHSQSEMCKQFGHKVLWHNAEKRFFKCKPCGKRAISYCKYPTKPCVGCLSTTFDRVAMRDERKGPKLANEKLKIRGDEEPFLNK